ncbi:MAG: hypothetical protein H6718_04700 [Polyangiaceae bacterium]|nr:hypothetical protein [Myxococcales bacterium]MCB9584670.1 hypothetical protein [Polyangiaceae bacterium]MCB9609107.1 hypothetical protein [Polyangiaceae bacterium]
MAASLPRSVLDAAQRFLAEGQGLASARRRYLDAGGVDQLWASRMSELGARELPRGISSEGRPLVSYRIGTPGTPRVLLTGLVHGVELIGSLALLAAVEALVDSGLHRELDLLIAPVVNPDALAHNTERLARGHLAWRRCNARGVDLNRNFGVVGSDPHLHPFSGSKQRWAPHYSGPEPFSEAESRWLADLARAQRPELALGFHSFGRLLLYPWGHTRALHPRDVEYRDLAARFVAAQPRPFQAKQAFGFYPTHGDLDDWLDHELGTLAYTVEVSDLSARLLRPKLGLNPFWWMNPLQVEHAVSEVVPGVLGMAQALIEERRLGTLIDLPLQPHALAEAAE